MLGLHLASEQYNDAYYLFRAYGSGGERVQFAQYLIPAYRNRFKSNTCGIKIVQIVGMQADNFKVKNFCFDKNRFFSSNKRGHNQLNSN